MIQFSSVSVANAETQKADISLVILLGGHMHCDKPSIIKWNNTSYCITPSLVWALPSLASYPEWAWVPSYEPRSLNYSARVHAYVQGMIIIGPSLSEPHTSGTAL